MFRDKYPKVVKCVLRVYRCFVSANIPIVRNEVISMFCTVGCNIFSVGTSSGEFVQHRLPGGSDGDNDHWWLSGIGVE